MGDSEGPAWGALHPSAPGSAHNLLLVSPDGPTSPPGNRADPLPADTPLRGHPYCVCTFSAALRPIPGSPAPNPLLIVPPACLETKSDPQGENKAK